jgi:hypothetical protein
MHGTYAICYYRFDLSEIVVRLSSELGGRRFAVSNNDKLCGKGASGRLLDFFDLIIGFFFLGISLLLWFYGLPVYQIGVGATVLFSILACIFIYEGATKPTTPRVAMTKDEINPTALQVATAKEEVRPQDPRTQLVEVTYAPITNLVVHEVIEQDQTTFFQDIVRQVSASPVHVEPSVNWVDGFALLSTQFPSTNEVIADNLAGKIHYQTVIFTRMPFHSKVSVKLGDEDFSVILRKADNDQNLVSLAAFLRGFKPRTRSHLSDPQVRRSAQDDKSAQIHENKGEDP